MRTVLHLTGNDPADCEHAMRSARVLRDHEELHHEDVALLLHRDGVWLVVPDSEYAEEVAALIEAGVTIRAGGTCFDARDLPREALPRVEIVPSGVSEAVRLQSAGYNYVKIP